MKRSNEKRIEDVFDWNFLISLGFTTDFATVGGTKLTSVSFGSFIKYDDAEIEVYGIGRRGTSVKGSLLIVED